MDNATHTQYELFDTFELLGWQAEKIVKKLHKTRGRKINRPVRAFRDPNIPRRR